VAGRASTPAPLESMTRALAFTGRATTDITDAFEWYSRQRSGLGEEFRAALSRAFDLALVVHPHRDADAENRFGSVPSLR